MRPVMFAFDLPIVGKIAFPAYFTLLTVGFGFAILLSWTDSKRLKIDADKIIDVNLWMIVFGVLGGRVLHVLADGHFMEYVNICIAPEKIQAVGAAVLSCTTDAQCGPHFLCNTAAGHCHPPRDCLLALKVWRGGLTYYGGFIFAASFGIYYGWRHKLPVWRAADLAGYGVPMGLFWGRMGCFLNGCCFGKLTRSAVGVVFIKGGAAWRHHRDLGLLASPTAAALPVHPTQLYSAMINLAIFAYLYFHVRTNKRFDGQVFWTFGILYSISRSLVEIFRDDDRGVIAGVLSTSQIISICLISLSLYMLRLLRRRSLRAEPPAGA